MCCIKQFSFLGVEPAFDLNFVALCTVAVTTGVVPDVFYMPIRTALYVPTHGRSPATDEVIGGFVVMRWQFLVFGIVFEGLPENALNGGAHCNPSENEKLSKIDYCSFHQLPPARAGLVQHPNQVRRRRNLVIFVMPLVTIHTCWLQNALLQQYLL